MKIENILLIDDSEMDNYISEYIIAESNIAENINVFNSPIEALEYLEILQNTGEKFPEAIFLDINMPEMSGFSFLDEFSKFSAAIVARTSVFMLTSSNDARDISRALKYPVVKRYFVKPLTNDILHELF